MESTKPHKMEFDPLPKSLLYSAVFDADRPSTGDRRSPVQLIYDATDEPSLIKYMERIGARLCVESDLVTARTPVANGGEVRAVVERLPEGGWDWIVWRATCPQDDRWQDTAHNRWLALSAACLVICQLCSAIPV